jgi:MOSC domain-containing protein YiiM
MKLISIHIGKSESFVGNGKEHRSAIDKKAVLSAQVEKLGLLGDVQVAKKHHGGPDQAVYAYAQSDYDWWMAEFSLETHGGSFGENLVIDAFDTNDIYVGDRFTIGDVILEVSAPRIPCNTLADRFDRKSLIKEFREAVRPGIYFRVIEEGEIFPDCEVEYVRGMYDISVNDFFNFYYAEKTVEEIQRYLAAPIDLRSRTAFQNKL